MAEQAQAVLVDSKGQPLRRETAKDGVAKRKSLFGATSSFWHALQQSRLPAYLRAADPLTQHAWIFAAVQVTAAVASQAPFVIYRETEDQLERRRQFHKRAGYGGNFTPRAGRARRALQRHGAIGKRMLGHGFEPDYEHPLNDLFTRPNPLLVGSQLWSLLYSWLRSRGEAFWLLAGEDTSRLRVGETPAEIWPVNPDVMEPIYETMLGGRLLGWRMRAPTYLPGAVSGTFIDLRLHEVVQFKTPDPMNPVRGLNPFAPLAGGVETDLLTKAHARSTLRNRAMPGGFLSAPELDDVAEKDLKEKIEETYAGEAKTGKTAVFAEGIKWVPMSWNMQELAAFDMLRWNREESLAVMQTPPAVHGLEDVANYATALVHDLSFWEKTILPMIRGAEATIDATLLFNQTDDVFGCFDLTQIDAFRAGLLDKLNSAEKLCGDKLHVPPKIAFPMVGLDVPEYDGDDVALVSSVLAPAADVISGEGMDGPPAPAPAPAAPDPEDDDPPEDPEEPEAVEQRRAADKQRRRKASSSARGRAFIRLSARLEGRMKKAYRTWIDETRRAVLKKFDELARRERAMKAGESIDLAAVLPDVDGLKPGLRQKTRPVYSTILDETFKFTTDELGGPPVFQIDNAQLQGVINEREKIFLQKVPQTVVDNLRTSLTEGIQGGESIQELRLRIGQVFDVASSSAKALTIARTETASVMNATRDAMFGLQGFTTQEWVTAGDEHVRDTHELYGAAGPVPRGFDYLTLSGKTNGRLLFPGDPEGPPEEVINCRCTVVPVE